MKKIGFIGMGNMGYAILKKLTTVIDKEEIIFTDIDKERCRFVNGDTGVEYAGGNLECAEKADFIVLAVKPQFLPQVLSELTRVHSLAGKIIISIVAGITISDICEMIAGDTSKVVRAMPNTPALVGEGMTGVAYDEELFDDDEKKLIDVFFSSFGKYEKISEKLMNVVTCVSGSSPAYVFMFIEALADSAVKYGMSRDTAYKFAAQAVAGSAMLFMDGKKHPGELKDMVCSPGGTTIAGVAALEEYGFRNAIIKATDECYKKGCDMKGLIWKN